MDASQYKDYILTLLFVKYVSDKREADPDSLIDVPPGGSFKDMLDLKGSKEIGDRINKMQEVAKVDRPKGRITENLRPTPSAHLARQASGRSAPRTRYAASLSAAHS